MNILHIASYDISGGAARAAYRLHKGLQKIDLKSFMFVKNRASIDSTVKSFSESRVFSKRLKRRYRSMSINYSLMRYRKTRPTGYEQFSDTRSQYGSELISQLPNYDVINLHWIADFIDYRSFIPYIVNKGPIVWTLHDMNAFTGGCHYDHDCRRYYEACGKCPQLGSKNQNDLSHKIWSTKQKIFSTIPKEHLSIVTNSHWLKREAKRSSLLKKFSVKTIHYGIDLKIFSPRDSALARRALDVPQDAKIVLFAADSVANKRKGFALLLEALKKIKNEKKLFLISVGEQNVAIDNHISHLNLGHIENDRLLSLIYSASNVYVIPSIHEAFGQTALEAMACGVPAVGFDTGGIPDIIRPNITGYLVPPGDLNALQSAIANLLQNSDTQKMMADKCRQITAEEFSLEIQARNYFKLYNRLCEGMRLKN